MKLSSTMGNPMPRFGNDIVKLNGFERNLYGAASRFLTLSERSERFFTDFIQRHPNSLLARSVGAVGKTVVPNILKHDYCEKAALPKLGKVVVDPPIGALIFLLFGFALTGRLTNALRRASDGDKRELRDIAFRDIPTFGTILFAYKPLVRVLSKLFQKIHGIQLLQGKHVLGYDELKDIYTVDTANRLKAVLLEPKNHKGVLTSMDKAMHNPNLSSPVKHFLKRYRVAVQECINQIGQTGGAATPEFEKAAQKAFRFLEILNTHRNHALKKIKEGSGSLAPRFIQKQIKHFNAKVPAFDSLFLSQAKGSRNWVVAISSVAILSLLGFWIPWFNKWYTEREFKKFQAQNSAPPQ